MEEKLTLRKVAEALGELTRRIDSIEKSVDLLSTDERNVLENINQRLAGIEEAMNVTRQHDDTVRKDIKEEINKVEFTVGEKVDEIKDKIDTKTVIQAKAQGVGDKIKNLLLGRK